LIIIDVKIKLKFKIKIKYHSIIIIIIINIIICWTIAGHVLETSDISTLLYTDYHVCGSYT